ncbi:universal stress protein [Luteimonas yindakuii]|uniref:universal stress protein n=1 Tax=Luteimonas yindakuii TaxID=2565782 RepID=UPI00313457E1
MAAQVLHIEERVPAEAIIDAAREHGCDLVVMASHGRSGFGRLLLGSQTQAVVGRSSVPVLVVH